MAYILHATTLRPEYTYKTKDIISYADSVWFKNLEPMQRKLAIKIFESSQIEQRSSALPIETVFSDLSFEQKNNLYADAMVRLGEQVLRQALSESEILPQQIDFLITTSCTGFMIPSVDAYLVNRLNLRQDIIRLPVTEMGCAGGTSALIYAKQFAQANPDKYIAVVSVEIPSITFQLRDLSMENFVSTAIFADGASAVILGPKRGLCPKITATDMYHFPDSTELMGYHLQNSGLKIILDREVPDSIQEHFPKFFFPFLERNGVRAEDIHHYMFHPGGKKIINRVEEFIGRYGKDISDSKRVLAEHGNMSSSTILFILEKTLKKQVRAGDKGYMLAFGPGFSAQSLLLEWQ